MSAGELRRVLVADDDQDLLALVKLTLEAVGGLSVQTAASGDEAVDAAVALQPDLVLLDVQLGQERGPEILARLRAEPRTAGLRVAFMTASAQQDEVEALRRLDALGVIAKPFDPMTLHRTLLRLWREGG